MYADSGSKVDIGSSMSIYLYWTDTSLLPALRDGSFSCRTHYIPGLTNSYGPRFAAVVSRDLSDVVYLGNGRWQNQITVVVNTQAIWSYGLYPFDQQTFKYQFFFSRGDHFFERCDSAVVDSFGHWTQLTTTAKQSGFLLSQEWGLHGDGFSTDLIGFRPDANYGCEMEVKIDRNPTVYIIKSMLLDVLVVIAGLAATQLNPMLPPFFGARTGTLMTAMLMTINKSAPRVVRGGASSSREHHQQRVQCLTTPPAVCPRVQAHGATSALADSAICKPPPHRRTAGESHRYTRCIY